jgi:hypothetical protein
MPTPKTTPRDVFQHLLMIVTLYISVFSLNALIFNYINILLPDQLDYYYMGALDGIRWYSSMLFVGFPIFILISWFIQKEFKKEPARHEIKVRKWLIYLTLFIAAITIIIDLVQLVNSFYGGELTTKFLLKLMTVLLITGVTFGYYLWDLKGDSSKSNLPKTAAWATSAVLVIAIISGFFIVGSPAKQREIRFDQRRVGDLQTLQNETINYWTSKNILPAKMDDLKNSISGFVPPSDPETNLPYKYEIITPTSFRLCADFKWPSLDQKFNPSTTSITPTAPAPYYNGYYGGPDQNWSHGAGEKCFERAIDPAIYKPVK